MCWKELSFLDERCPLIKVEGGTNGALDYNGIYLANKYNDAQYFKLGTKGFFTLSKFSGVDGKKESWGFKSAFSNYSYTADNITDYLISSNPFETGYGDNITVSCTTIEEAFPPATPSATATYIPAKLYKPSKTQEEYIAPPASAPKNDRIFFAPTINAPEITSKSIKNSLLQDDAEDIKITWGQLENVDEYRVEIFREEKGSYNSKSYFTPDTEFTYNPEGGNYFVKINGVRHMGNGDAYGYDSETYKFTKLYPGNCPEKDITIHFDHYEDKHVYVKIEGVWYGTGDKYGEPVSMVTFPCPVTIDEFDYDNNPNHLVVLLGRDKSRILKSVDLRTDEQEAKIKSEIKELYSKQLINQSTVIASKYIFP
jgi:hypothetical protein